MFIDLARRGLLIAYVENGVRKVYQLIFDNIGKGGFVGTLDTSMQSDGTLRERQASVRT